MQRLEVSCAVRLIYKSLRAKGLTPFYRYLISPATIKPTQVFMQSAEYCYQILTKFGFSRQISVEIPNIKFQGNPSSGSRADTCGKARRFSILRERAKKSKLCKKNDPHSQLKTTGGREEAAMASIHLSVMVPSSKYRLLQAFYDVTFESTLTTLSLPLLL